MEAAEAEAELAARWSRLRAERLDTAAAAEGEAVAAQVAGAARLPVHPGLW